MAKQIQLNIPEPCHEDWDAMTPADKGRFCGACQKQVVDFTRMSDAQVAAFFKKPSTGSVCGRFMGDQLNRDIEIPRKRIPWIKYFFQFAIPAFLASSKAYTQGAVIVRKPQQLTVCAPEQLTDSIAYPKKDSTPGPDSIRSDFFGGISLKSGFPIKGKVTDEAGNPIPNAAVFIKGTKLGVSTGSDGSFQLWCDGKKGDLVAAFVGYEPAETTIDPKKMQQLILFQLSVVVKGEVVMTRKKKVHVPSLIRTIGDTIVKKIKLFPNPVQAGSDLNVQCDRMDEGYYSLELLTLAGSLVFRKEIWIDDKARLINLPVPVVAAGTYLFRMINKESQKHTTQKIVIQ